MAKRMLIDSTHPEETRVVVVSGKRLEEFDFETSNKKQLKGNIYLAKVTRVEPSLQAAFVDYGGNRHGFLAFSEIHPDYYRIPVADREALLAEEAAMAEESGDEPPEGAEEPEQDHREAFPADGPEPAAGEHGTAEDEAPESEDSESEDVQAGGSVRAAAARAADWSDRLAEDLDGSWPGEPGSGGDAPAADHPAEDDAGDDASDDDDEVGHLREAGDRRARSSPAGTVETVGGDEMEDDVEPRRSRSARHYKIQEVIKRRQIMLVQVTKEERGNKGAALTTYLSLAGRYCVLMPNTARGGGVSRKITNPADRKRLKSVIGELEIPEGMAVIVRTAGSERSKAEIRRDYEYLLRLWDEIRELTLKSTAPALIYEEANLIKRSIRDLYSRDIEDILVEGEEGYKAAKAFMRTLTPSHARRVQLYKDPAIPLFHRFQVEGQLDAIHNPVVQLKSGGYIVINPTEALVAIDVNSGRATRERNIEETALRTNQEAAEEIARQLRLRDLAGLVVIDFIDMEEPRHNAAVERRLKEAMRTDRARVQLGHISPFGLLELSRQRLRPSLLEASTETCPRCRGIGHIRSTESTALHVLRSVEEEGIRHRSAAINVEVPTAVALYVLNQKRKALAEIEARHGLQVFLAGDEALVPPDFRIERMKALPPQAGTAAPVSHVSAPLVEDELEDAEAEEAVAEPKEAGAEAGEQQPAAGRRRPRRRRRRDEGRPAKSADMPGPGNGRAKAAAAEPTGETEESEAEAAEGDAEGGDKAGRHRRRRGRRGGRRRTRRGEAAATDGGQEDGRQEETAQENDGQAVDDGSAPEIAAAPVEAPGAPAAPWSTLPQAGEEAGVEPAGPVAEEPADRQVAPDGWPAPTPPEEPRAETAAETAGEPAVQPEAAGEPEREPAGTPPEPELGLQPDDARRSEPAAALSYLPVPPAWPRTESDSPQPSESDRPETDHRPATEESRSEARRRGWWRRQQAE